MFMDHHVTLCIFMTLLRICDFSQNVKCLTLFRSSADTYQNTQGTDFVSDPNNATEGICKYFFLLQTAWSMFIF